MEGLKNIFPPERIRDRLIDRVSFASDAGFYYLLPRAVVQPCNEQEIRQLFEFSHAQKVPLVFRAGGTSLSGQSVTDGILVDLSLYWKKISVEQQGLLVRVQPGITGAMVNARLQPYGRKIGPDPSSISAAMMGGILSNNASGMCCGVKDNSYHTTRHIRFILPDGQSFSTESETDYDRFAQACPGLCNGLAALRDRIRGNVVLRDRIRHKYLTKTTVGYSLNALLDYEHPLEIFSHLLIGGEGTLAFIAEAVLVTIGEKKHKATALLYFPDIFNACQAIVPLSSQGAAMVELMDRASLRAIEDLPGVPSLVKTLPAPAAALLVEFQQDNEAELEIQVNNFLAAAESLSLLTLPTFSMEAEAREQLWKLRKGLFPAVGAVRARGTSVILEDIAFPVAVLGAAILSLQELFQKHAYDNAIIFGHARDGNIHFVITQAFDTASEVRRYELFIGDLVELVVKRFGGTLKAEHGTGRNMAPFVETEWGKEAYGIMQEIKKLADPRGLLNPGVIINADPRAHLQDLKAMPQVEQEVDKCIECGYCEPRCPSRDLTTSPRRRIVVRRVLQGMKARGEKKAFRELSGQFLYEGLETCAVDGLCASDCPVDINTGELIKRLRRESHQAPANWLALQVARHFLLTEKLVRLLLWTGSGLNTLFGKNFLTKITGSLKKIIPPLPLWMPELGAPPSRAWLRTAASQQPATGEAAIVYFPSCISRVMGSYPGKSRNLMESFLSLCQKAGVRVLLPRKTEGSCCSQIFGSKGFSAAYQYKANEIIEILWAASHEGRFIVVTDVSSCAYTLQKIRPVLTTDNRQRFDRLRILDSVEFLHDHLMPRLPAHHPKGEILLHPVCSLEKMKTTSQLAALARNYSSKVTVPQNAGCCGMAGDRGFTHPELTAAATRPEALEIKGQSFEGYYSSTRTCELAMSRATGQDYLSILYLLDETTEGEGQ